MLGLERNLGYCVEGSAKDTSHHAQEVISPKGGGALGYNLGAECRQDSQTLSLEYTFVAKNIPLNLQNMPKITRSYTVSGLSILFIRPIQIWTITHPF